MHDEMTYFIFLYFVGDLSEAENVSCKNSGSPIASSVSNGKFPIVPSFCLVLTTFRQLATGPF